MNNLLKKPKEINWKVIALCIFIPAILSNINIICEKKAIYSYAVSDNVCIPLIIIQVICAFIAAKTYFVARLSVKSELSNSLQRSMGIGAFFCAMFFQVLISMGIYIVLSYILGF